jgi:stage II sporulation protein D
LRSSAAAALAVGLAAAACVGTPAQPRERSGRNSAPPARDDGGPAVRVALARAAAGGEAGGSGAWRLYAGSGRSVLVRGTGGERWRVERQGRRLRAVRSDGVPTPYQVEPLVVRAADATALVSWDGRRYRGELTLTATDSGVLVVNRLPMESYLRGVVPLELTGRPSPAEQAAVEAQAVAARSYASTRLSPAATRGYDLVATVQDQVYGGADAERPATDAGVERTRGLVLTYAGRVVAAPYSSTCGGSTAEATEVWWRRAPAPYLQSVSDRIPGAGDRYYCDASPRFTWTERLDGAALTAAVDRYLAAYAAVPRGGVGAVRFVSVQGVTPSGRAAALRIDADRGSYEVRGDDIRRVLRASGGGILGSTYFTVEPVVGRGGRLQELTVRGGGNGHGVGMCQWGALGRARAGQSYREILQAYYPGTSVAPAP